LVPGGAPLSGLVRWAVPDAEGRFAVSDVSPGPQQVLVQVDRAVRARQGITVAAGQTVEAELRLTAADGVLVGIVTDETGNPRENARK
jgi:hypothetical protein